MFIVPAHLYYFSLERISRTIETLVINMTQKGRVIHVSIFSGGHFGNVPKVLNMFIPFDLVILLLGIYLTHTKNLHTDLGTRIFITGSVYNKESRKLAYMSFLMFY